MYHRGWFGLIDLTYSPKINRKYIFKWQFFHCHVSFQECIPRKIHIPIRSKENHLSQSFMIVFHVNCLGCIFWPIWWIFWPIFLKTCHGKRILGSLSGYQGVLGRLRNAFKFFILPVPPGFSLATRCSILLWELSWELQTVRTEIQ